MGRIKQGLSVRLLTPGPSIITKGQLFCPTLLFLQISLTKHAINMPLVVLVLVFVCLFGSEESLKMDAVLNKIWKNWEEMGGNWDFEITG